MTSPLTSHFSPPVKSDAAAGRPQPTPEQSGVSRLVFKLRWRIRLALSLSPILRYGFSSSAWGKSQKSWSGPGDNAIPSLPVVRKEKLGTLVDLTWKDFITSISED